MACFDVPIPSKLPLHKGLALPWGMQQLRDHRGDLITDLRRRLMVCADQVPAGKDPGRAKDFQRSVLWLPELC